MIKAALYARYSSDNQREESIDAQIRAVKEYADKNGYSIVKTYTDEARSATTDDRPGFLKMIDDSNNRNFDYIIVHKLDRFARNRYDSAFYKKKLKENGIRLLSVLENLDDSPESIILESVLEGMSEYYSKNLAREVRKGMKENALQARHNGGQPPLGYDVDSEGFYIINEKESEIIKLIFNLYLNGYGYASISAELNKLGYRTKRGIEFSKTSIRDTLLNEKYTGTYVFGKKDKHGKLTGSEIRKENALPIIIHKQIFDKVQEMFNKKVRGPRQNSKVNYILSGYIECAHCGGQYVGSGKVNGRSKQYYIYACSTRNRKKIDACSNMSIRKDLLEKFVLDSIRDNILTPAKIDELSAKVSEHIEKYCNESKSEIIRLKNLIKETQTRIDKMLDAFLDGAMPKSMLSEKSHKLQADLNLYNEQLIEIETNSYSSFDVEKIKAFLSSFHINSDDEKEQRKAIETFVHKIIISKESIEVLMTLDPLHPVFTDSDRVGGGEAHITVSLSNFIIRTELYHEKTVVNY